MDEKKDIERSLEGVDAEKRETLKKLATAAWAIPVVTTFTLGTLGSSKGMAQSIIDISNAVTLS